MMVAESHPAVRTVALIGANGMLASMVRAKAQPEYDLHLFDLPEFDLTDSVQVHETLRALRPAVIINCAAYTNVDGCETEQELALAVNGAAVATLAEVARSIDATLVHISTDYVFDGLKTSPYSEGDVTAPQSTYGRSKLAGEQAIISSGLEKYFIIRTSWLYGPGGQNFVETILRLATERETLRIVADQFGSPTFTGDLADAIFSLLTQELSCGSGCYGVYHFANEGQCSWYDFACEIVAQARKKALPLKIVELSPIATEEYPLPAKRPAFSVFDKTKYKACTGAVIPDWRKSLEAYFLLREKNS